MIENRPEFRASYTLKDAADALGVTVRALRHLIETGAVPAIRLGDRRLFVPGSYIEQVWAGSPGDRVENVPRSDN